MDYIDLVALLRAFQQKGLEKCEVYGKITRTLHKPDNIFDSVKLSDTGIFFEMSVFAVNLGYYKSYLASSGFKSSDDIYMVNGSIIIYAENNVEVGEWYSARGTLRFGTKDPSNTYVGLLTYYKNDNAWFLKPCVLNDIDLNLWDKDTTCYKFMNLSIDSNDVVHPGVVNSLPRFSSTRARVEQTHESIEQIPTTVNKFKKISRSSIAEKSNTIDKLQGILADAKVAKEKYLKSLIAEYGQTSLSYVHELVNNIVLNLNVTSTGSVTGKRLLKGYLSNYSGSEKKYIGKQTNADYLASIFGEVALYLFDHNETVTADGSAWSLCKQAFGDIEIFYAGMVSEICGVPYDDMLVACLMCKKYDLSMVNILNRNPYVLQYLGVLSFSYIEKLAVCFKKNEDKTIEKHRNIAYINNYIEDSMNSSSTIFEIDKIKFPSIGVSLTKSKYIALQNYGSMLSQSVTAKVAAFLGKARLTYNLTDFKRDVNGNYVRGMNYNTFQASLKDYTESGMGVIFDSYVTSTNLMEKEVFVYKSMYEMGSRVNDYSVEEIDKLISEYEDEVGFTLEPEQRDGVRLIVNSSFIIAGSAGSGKTTTSNCVLYVLEHLEDNLNVKFAAPTGKAAKHMQEVIHRQVKTAHSEFKIGFGSTNAFEHEEDDGFSNTVYFFDESAMFTLDLFYKILKRIDTETCRVYLFGDFNQLPPIGKGLPFKNLLRFMPCKFLTVSKRAEEGSQITANSNYINEYSDYNNWRELTSSGDFLLLPCRSSNIQQYVYDLCAYYLGLKSDYEMESICKQLGVARLPVIDNLLADDIQVVTPLAKSSYSWGAKSLNQVLQPLFNPARGFDKTFIYQLTEKSEGVKFKIDDRVIHTDKNMYSMQWYIEVEKGVFEKIYGFGICNGEVGRVTGIYPSVDVEIREESEDCPDGFQYMDSLRDDTSWDGDLKFFVSVAYYDYLSDREITILYRAEQNTYVQNSEGLVFKGDDLAKLALFYAGTTHKLQGSEAQVVICPLDSVNYSGFITREMLYTMFTRGKKLVIPVGSVENSRNSMLSRARRDLASVDTLTVGELLYKE